MNRGAFQPVSQPDKKIMMKKLLFLLCLTVTACHSEQSMRLGTPGKITAHIELVKMVDKHGDTLKCLAFSLTNESEHNYYLPQWGLRGGIKFNYSWSDTSLYDVECAIPTLYKLISAPFTEKGFEMEKTLRPYLLSRQQPGNPFFADSAAFKKVERTLKEKHIRQVFRYNPSLSKGKRERIKQVLMEQSYINPVLIKAGSTVMVGLIGDLADQIIDGKRRYSFENYPTEDREIFLTYYSMPIPDFMQKDSVWIYADELKDVLPSQEYKAPGKLWYYDPVPYPKYKSYYPYLGDITCSDTIVIRSGYLLE